MLLANSWNSSRFVTKSAIVPLVPGLAAIAVWGVVREWVGVVGYVGWASGVSPLTTLDKVDGHFLGIVLSRCDSRVCVGRRIRACGRHGRGRFVARSRDRRGGRVAQRDSGDRRGGAQVIDGGGERGHAGI